jgi:hypothetical protein
VWAAPVIGLLIANWACIGGRGLRPDGFGKADVGDPKMTLDFAFAEALPRAPR